MSNYRIPVNDVEIPIRIFSHSNRAPNSANRIFIHFHGGGWVHGDLEFYSPTCLRYAYHFEATVISVDYRKSPEHKFPIPFIDCVEIAKWVIENKCLFGKKEIPIYLIGESAGGNLVAAVSLYLRDHQINDIKGQILMYPVTDSNINYPSVEKFKNGYLLTKESLIYFLDAYKSKDEDLENPYFAPIKATNLENLPSAIIVTCSHDVLRDQAFEYHKKLNNSGIESYYRNYLLSLHGFLNAPELFFRGGEMYKDFIKFIKEKFFTRE
ncbi:MAG: alpha/beta hydrolase [Asgard group archaeon]|nr:alpha/beta hydrolase [Asgard group archaeon]